MKLNELTVKNLETGRRYSVWCDDVRAFGIRINQRSKTFVLKKNNRYIVLGRYPLISLRQARDEARRRLALRYFPQQSVNVREAVREFLITRQDTLKPSTHRVYGTYLRLLDRPVQDIDARYVYSVLPAGKGAGNLAFNVMKAFLSWCVERDYIQHNPLLRRRQPNRLKSRERLLSDAEIAAIWTESYNHDSSGSSSASPSSPANA